MERFEAGSPRTVVIVEDEPELVSLLEELLISGGYRAEAVRPSHSVERILRAAPDLVVLDYSMPGVTGREVIERLRACGDGILPPILLVSGLETIVATGRELGVDCVLRKPFDLDVFLEAVDGLVGGAKGDVVDVG